MSQGCNTPDPLAGRGANYSAPAGITEDPCEDNCPVVLAPETLEALKPNPLEMANAICADAAASAVLKACIDTTVTYVPTIEGDVVTVTGSDGTVQTITITHPEDVDPVTTNIVDGVLRFYDADGNEIESLAQDFAAFVSSPHPTISASGDATIAQDADGNWVVGFVDTDTDTTYAIVNGNLVGSDGTSVPLPDTDTDISAVDLVFKGGSNTLEFSVTEDGTTQTASLPIPTVDQTCGDLVLTRDPATAKLTFKERKPQALMSSTVSATTHVFVEGGAVDILVGTVLASIEHTSDEIEPNKECWQNRLLSMVRLGSWSTGMGTPGDFWTIRFLKTAGAHMLLTPVFETTYTGTTSLSIDYYKHSYGVTTGTDSLKRNSGAGSYTHSWDVEFLPPFYTPHPDNSLLGGALLIRHDREQKEYV